MIQLLPISPLLLVLVSAQTSAALPAVDDIEYAVIKTLLLSWYGDDASLVPALVMADTIEPKKDEFGVRHAEEVMPDLEAATVESFLTRSAAGGRLADRFDLSHPVRLMPRSELTRAFISAHRDVSYLGEFSRVGVNSDRTQAIVGHSTHFGADLFELWKVKGHWKVVQRVVLWEQ